MKLTSLVLAAALALGTAGAVAAAPLTSAAEQMAQQPDTVVAYAKAHGRGHALRGNRGHHYGLYRGRHRGWHRPHRRALYVAPRRHYGWYRGRHRHNGWYRHHHHRRPARGVYFRF